MRSCFRKKEKEKKRKEGPLESLMVPSVSLLGSTRLDGKAWFILGEKELEVRPWGQQTGSESSWLVSCQQPSGVLPKDCRRPEGTKGCSSSLDET